MLKPVTAYDGTYGSTSKEGEESYERYVEERNNILGSFDALLS